MGDDEGAVDQNTDSALQVTVGKRGGRREGNREERRMVEGWRREDNI